MDRNTVIGILLIGILLFGYSIFTRPDKEELEKARRKQDSIALIEQQRILKETIKEQEAINTQQTIVEDQDFVAVENAIKEYGMFGESAVGVQEFIILENDLMEILISSRGGRVYSVNLKKFRTHDSLPLILFNGDSTIFGLSFFAQNRSINTNNLFFTPEKDDKKIVVTDKSRSLAMRLYASGGQYIEYLYTLEPGAYTLGLDVNIVGMNEIISQNTQYLTLNWEYFVPSQEKGQDFENQYTSIYYKYYEDEVDNLNARSDDSKESLKTRLKWIAFKQQFFSSVLIADTYFSNAFVMQENMENSNDFLKFFRAEISIPFEGKPNESIPMQFYFGPNHYTTLKKYKLSMDQLVELGWGIFGWINRFAVIPVFNWLSRSIENYGLIILILTILIKIVIFPFTFKSYQSTAKMRVLKPQIDEIGKKFSKQEDAMKKQQATMALYKKVGVNPIGGCLPMVFQMPILIAIFRFFPASIELRQKSFLWADDLSSYDSVLDLPWDIPFYGDHVSLFTLLMTISTIIYTKLNSQMQSANAQMPGMKYMMYMFPVMMLFWFNSYAAGLSYYYFLANILTFGQMYLIKRFVDDEEVLKKLQVTKKKTKKKSGFQKRLEDAAKQRGYKMPKK